MKIVARQWRRIMILRVAIGCGVVAMGLQRPWLSLKEMIEDHDWSFFGHRFRRALRYALREATLSTTPDWNGGRAVSRSGDIASAWFAS